MENCVKTVLYAYPVLQRAEEAYAHHIRNRAVLSCDGRMDTEKLTEYLLEEILQKRRLEWLKNTIDEVLNRLNALERALIEAAFLKKRRKIKRVVDKSIKQVLNIKSWSDHTRLRFLNRAFQKVKAMLIAQGLTKTRFEEEFLSIETIGKIYRRVLFSSTKSYGQASYSSIS